MPAGVFPIPPNGAKMIRMRAVRQRLQRDRSSGPAPTHHFFGDHLYMIGDLAAFEIDDVRYLGVDRQQQFMPIIIEKYIGILVCRQETGAQTVV